MLLLKNLLSNEEQKKTKRLTKENRLEAIQRKQKREAAATRKY